MAAERCAVRVLRTYALGETSLIAVLIAREKGILRAVAKGARDGRSRYRGLIEPGFPLTAQIYLKPKGLHLLGETGLRGRLPRTAPRLENLALRMAALELVLCSTEEGEPLLGLFELLEDYLGIFDEGAEEGYLPLFAFEARLLALHGLLPELTVCSHCGRAMGGGPLRFLPGEGLFACGACGPEGIDLAPVEAECLHSIFSARPSELTGRLLEGSARSAVGRVLHLALSRHLTGYKLPRSLAMLGAVSAQNDKEPGQ
jgi:DNA repair protein RecO (recombination protein O)